MTADEAMSLALPDRICRSPPKRSTVFSIALLSNSTMINRNSGMINVNHSSSVCARPNDRMNNIIDPTTSCLKADSCVQASRMPFNEFFVAAKILAIPVSPGFKLTDLLAMTVCVFFSFQFQMVDSNSKPMLLQLVLCVSWTGTTIRSSKK